MDEKMSISKWTRKLRLLFSKIFEDDYELNSYHSDRILKYLQTAPICGIEKTLLESSLLSDIILMTYKEYGTRRNSVKIFIAKILTQIYRQELDFSKLKDVIGLNRCSIYMCTHDRCAQDSNLLLECINVLTAPIGHYSGVKWLVEHKIWRIILCSCIHTRPVHVSRAAYKFITLLLWKLNEYEEEVLLLEILDFIIKPITHNEYHRMKVINEGEEEIAYAPMMTYLNALLEVLNDIKEQTKTIDKIIVLLTQQFNLELQLQVLLDLTRDPRFAKILSELLFKIYIAAVREAYFKYKKTVNEVLNEITLIYNNIVQKLIVKQMTEAVADFAVKCNLFLSKLGAAKPLEFEIDGKRFEFQNQFILHLVVPLWTYYVQNCASEVKLDEIDNYSFKLINITAEHIARSAEFFCTVVEKHSADIKKITIYTVKNLFHFREQLNKATAGILYQGLYYVLQTFVIMDDVGSHLILSENPVKSPDDCKLLSLVLDAIKMLLKEHTINWYENVEIICLQVTLLNLLKQKFMSTKELVQTIDLINLSVNKFISPDMTLLVESKSGSSLTEIGTMTKEYVQHEDWEVRESALSLLLTCTDISFVKYMPLQKVIFRDNLMTLAAKYALCDPEAYVQATALRCLAAATRIDKIWRNVTKVHSDLHVQLMHMAKKHEEETIRKEAVKLLTEIYLNQNVTCEFSRRMFTVMAGVALDDPNWEVQVAALNFWRHAIKQQCLDRGMIDGKFPSVTFSKEKRKIIVFNEEEIKKQLNTMMNELSSIGCLNVLDKCLDEERDVGVMEEALKIVTDLRIMLDHYKFSAVQSPTTTLTAAISCIEMDLEDELETDKEMATPHDTCNDIRDMIIDEIINTKQIDLVTDILDKSLDQPKGAIEIETEIQYKDLIQPYHFLEKLKSTNYEAIIENKKKWDCDVISLDDIIEEIDNGNLQNQIQHYY